MQLAGNTFLVTGAASGLGAGTARLFVESGAQVVAVDLDADRGRAISAELGERARFVAADVTDESAVKRAVAEAIGTFGGLHGAVHCAGIVAGSRVVGRDGPHDLALFQRVIQVNLIGTFNVVRLAAEAMIKNTPNAEGERGAIVTTASVSAFEGQIGQAAYAASKGGVASMTLPIARELAQFGIRVVSIAPGIFETPLMESLPAGVRESLARQPAFPQRLGRPEEFAALARHAIENPMLNGCTIRLDGAIRMQAK